MFLGSGYHQDQIAFPMGDDAPSFGVQGHHAEEQVPHAPEAGLAPPPRVDQHAQAPMSAAVAPQQNEALRQYALMGESELTDEDLLLIPDPLPAPEVTVAAGAIEPGVALILARAQTTALKNMGAIPTDPEHAQQQAAAETEIVQRNRTQRTQIRRAIFDDVIRRFVHMMMPERGADVEEFRNEAWRGFKGTTSDVPDRVAMTRMLFQTYFPGMQNPPQMLGALDPPTDTLIAQGIFYSTYKKMLADTRNTELYPSGNVPAPPARSKAAKRALEETLPVHEPVVVQVESAPKKPRIVLRISGAKPAAPAAQVASVPVQQMQQVATAPVPQAPVALAEQVAAAPVQPVPAVALEPKEQEPKSVTLATAPPANESPVTQVAAPPSSPEVAVAPQAAQQEDSFDKTEFDLRASLEDAKKDVEASVVAHAARATRLESATRATAAAEAAVIAARANLVAAEEKLAAANSEEHAAAAGCVAATANADMARRALDAAVEKLKQYETNKVVCVCCKKFSNKIVVLSLTCGHICCGVCADKFIAGLVDKAKNEDKPVMCPCCSGASPDVPQLAALCRPEVKALVPEAAKGFIDPFALSGKIDPAIKREVALQQLAFPEFVCEPVPAGTRPARSCCPKCQITPTYGLSNIEHNAVRCTNPDCCVIYCCKCKAHPFHIGKKC